MIGFSNYSQMHIRCTNSIYGSWINRSATYCISYGAHSLTTCGNASLTPTLINFKHRTMCPPCCMLVALYLFIYLTIATRPPPQSFGCGFLNDRGPHVATTTHMKAPLEKLQPY